MNIFNFDNIGSKVKSLAKWSCWITIILIWIAAVIIVIGGITEGEMLLALLAPFIAAVASVFVWIGSWAMYAFGELVEKTCENENNTREIVKKLSENPKTKRVAAQGKHEEEKNKKKTVENARCEGNKTVRNENEQLTVADIEGAASAYLNRRISISDISCTLIYVIPKSTGIPKEMHLNMAAGNQEFTSLDLFFDRNRCAYYFKGRHLALDDAWHSEEEIFSFKVNMFKEFNTDVDEDD